MRSRNENWCPKCAELWAAYDAATRKYIDLIKEQAWSAGCYLWQGSRAYFELVPESLPAHIVRLRRWVRTEKQFDYYP